MIIGDVIELDGTLGVVRRLDKQARIAIVQRGDLSIIEVEDDLERFEPERCKVLHNPARDWAFLKVPDNRRLGLFVGLDQAGVGPLTLFRDWLPTEFGKTGCIFMSPALRLGVGDILIVRFDKGATRVNVPRTLAPVGVHAAKAEAARANTEAIRAARAEARRRIEEMPVAYKNLRRVDEDGEGDT